MKARPAPSLATLRGIRPQVRAALLVIDLATFLSAAFVATVVGDITSTSVNGLVTLALVLYAGSLLADTRGETARTFDQHDVVRMLAGAAAGTLLAWIFEAVPSPLAHASGRLVIIAAGLGFVLRMLVRIAIVALRRSVYSRRTAAKRTLLVGAGRAAVALARVIRENRKLAFEVVGCVDDDVNVRRVEDLRVLGKLADLPQIIASEQIECVVIAIPSVSLQISNRIATVCAGARGAGGKPPLVKVYPGVLDLLNGGVQVSRIRDIKLEELLGREPIPRNASPAGPFLRNRVVLVTGAGGSIGSELCRQIASLEPRLLLLLGHGENSLFAIEAELREKHGFTRTRLVLADVANPVAIRSIFSQYRPDFVFHAAAHKHVPIVEANVCESLRNNVFGTHNVALAAAAAGVAKFVLLSTDKAVNPTSVMGATKRMAELICQSFGKYSRTEFVAVRFGNVLGSRGSVLPTFRRQLEAGGPLTVTHREMERYFMTIPEAVSLVLEATVIGHDGQVLVLDMGKPVKILTLAETVITLAGFTPYRDIDIVETGIRPGEKLYEELLTSQEGISRTGHDRLFIAQQERLEYAHLINGLARLESAVRKLDVSGAIAIVQEFIPSFVPQSANLEPDPAPAVAIAAPPARVVPVRTLTDAAETRRRPTVTAQPTSIAG